MQSFTDHSDPRVREMRRQLAGCLQLVGSVVEFRITRAGEPEGRAHLGWVLDKVTAITLVQRRLAEQPDFALYLEQVADFWRRNSGSARFAFTCKADSVDLPPEHSAALAVIVHELVANAVRHAFPDGRSGRIGIELQVEDGSVALSVRDDGIGISPEGTASGGLKLCEVLAAELGGQLAIVSDGGTAARVWLPLAPKRG